MSDERNHATDPAASCSCAIAGFCSRFGMQMTGRTHHLCRTNPDYRWLWSGKQGPPPSVLASPQFDCVHRGEWQGKESCVPCSVSGAVVEVDAFACNSPAVRQSRCSLTNEIEGGRPCDVCPQRRPASVDAILKQTTVCVTYWERPEALERLKASLAKFYPDLPVLIEDTGGNLSAGRNRLVEKCPTPFYLMLEEDFEFTKETRIERLASVLAENPGIGGAAGAAMEIRNGKRQAIFWDRKFRHIDGDAYLRRTDEPTRKTATGVVWKPCDLVLNFGLFRHDALASVRWDESLPVQEHSTYFFDQWRTGRWEFAYVPEVRVEHRRDRPSGTYRAGRNRRFSDRILETRGVTFRDTDTHPVPPLRNQNVVVLGVGRSNSSIVTEMLAKQYRLHAGEFNADEYAENRLFHEACVDALKTGVLDPVKAKRALRSLPEPFILKDPRLRTLLPQWLPYFEPFAPKLVYVTKDAAAVKASHDRAGWSGVYRESNAEACEAHYAAWPWQKERFDAADLNEAVKLWSVDRFEASIARGRVEATA